MSSSFCDRSWRQAIEKQMDRIEHVHRFTRVRGSFSRRKKKTRRWPKPASGSSRRLLGGTSTAGEYDFWAEKLRDRVGIRLPKLGLKKEVVFDLIQTHKPQCTERIR